MFKKGYIPWNKGKKIDEKTRNKIRYSLKGLKPKNFFDMQKKAWEHNKGHIPWNKGKFSSRESVEKMRLAKTGVPTSKRGKHYPNVSGSNHWNWKGGISPMNELVRRTFEYKLWRQSVLFRDNFICQDCKNRGGKLEVHHIKPFSLFPELRSAIDNGVTLCKKCHGKTDTYAGKIKNKKYETIIN